MEAIALIESEIVLENNGLDENSEHCSLEKNDPSYFRCGLCFSSFSDLEKAIKAYCEKNFVALVKLKSMKWPDNHRHRNTLVYKYIAYCCKFGPKVHQSESKGLRKITTTKKIDCPFRIRLTSNGEYLEVRELNLTHNHELSEDQYRQLPEPLRLTETETKELELVMKTKGLNPKMMFLKRLIANRSGKSIKLKQLQNLCSRLKHKNRDMAPVNSRDELGVVASCTDTDSEPHTSSITDFDLSASMSDNAVSSESTTPLQPKGACNPPRKRKCEDPATNDIYEILKGAREKSEKRVVEDRHDIFGKHVANKLRSYTKKTEVLVQHHINNVLFQADLGEFESAIEIIHSEKNSNRF